MNDQPSFDEIRADVEAKQKAILWEDARKGGKSVDAFLWKGDPKAKPIQRAGLIIFAITFFFFTVIFASMPFQKHFEDGWAGAFVMALIALLITIRLVRNAFLYAPKPTHHTNDPESD